ncbi:hypothetical protein OAG11_01410 [Verrucomicrobia bacterium]|nr:hypothetical protein [Verrucomicrobiota bacterium]
MRILKIIENHVPWRIVWRLRDLGRKSSSNFISFTISGDQLGYDNGQKPQSRSAVFCMICYVNPSFPDE